jgi:cerevisin
MIGAFSLADFSREADFVDGYGHGTHVAGTIGSATWGVAKNTTLFAVRVLDSAGMGTNADVIAGMEFVVRDARERAKTDQCRKGFVANISLGGEKLPAMNDAVSGFFLFVVGSITNVDAGSSYCRSRHLPGGRSRQ